MPNDVETLPDPDNLTIGDWDLDEDLIAAVRAGSGPQARVIRHHDTTVVLGRGSRPEVEVELTAVVTDGVPVRRRRGGGCAVVLDPGNLVVSVVLPLPGLTRIRESYDLLTGWLIAGLSRIGVPGVRREGTSDLALLDRKIGGSCIWRTPGLLYYTTTLLVDPDIGKVERWLRHPPREPAYRRGRSHAAFMTSLAESFGRDDTDRLSARLTDALAPLPRF